MRAQADHSQPIERALHGLHEAHLYQDGSLAIVGNDDALDGWDVLPGFNCPLKDVLT